MKVFEINGQLNDVGGSLVSLGVIFGGTKGAAEEEARRRGGNTTPECTSTAIREIEVINLTPHDISLLHEGEMVTFPKSGEVARVEMGEEESYMLYPIPCKRQKWGEVVGLPSQKKNTFLLVSRMVFDTCDRKDAICPDTGSGAIRDEKGRIVAVTSFITK